MTNEEIQYANSQRLLALEMEQTNLEAEEWSHYQYCKYEVFDNLKIYTSDELDQMRKNLNDEIHLRIQELIGN